MAEFKYDESKDKILAHGIIESDTGKGGYEVKLCRYDGKDIKIQISPFYLKDGERMYTKLGRIRVDDFAAISDLASKLYKTLK